MSKKLGIIVGIVIVILIIVFACSRSNSAVFELQKGEAEALGVVFPEGADLISMYDEYMAKGEYEKAIVVAKKMEGYSSLARAYIKAGEYEKALVVNEKLLEITPNDYGCIMMRAIIFEQMDKQDEAVKVFENYKESEECQKEKECPEGIEQLISDLKKAQSEGTKLFPADAIR